MIKYMKELRLYVTRYLCGYPLKTKSRLVKVKNGFPVLLWEAKESIDSGNIKNIKFLLSILNISRGIDPKPSEEEKIPIDYSTITDPRKTKKEYFIPSWFIKEFIKYYDLQNVFEVRGPLQFSEKDYYLSSKEGPQGKSTMSCLESLKVLFKRVPGGNPNSHIHRAMAMLINKSGSLSHFFSWNMRLKDHGFDYLNPGTLKKNFNSS